MVQQKTLQLTDLINDVRMKKGKFINAIIILGRKIFEDIDPVALTDCLNKFGLILGNVTLKGIQLLEIAGPAIIFIPFDILGMFSLTRLLKKLKINFLDLPNIDFSKDINIPGINMGRLLLAIFNLFNIPPEINDMLKNIDKTDYVYKNNRKSNRKGGRKTRKLRRKKRG